MANYNPKKENLTAPRYKTGQSGNPKGRPKSRVPQYKVRIMGVSKAKKSFDMDIEELRDWYETLLTFNTLELKLLEKEETAPAIIRAYAHAMINDLKAGRTYTVDRITKRLFGKAIERIELTGSNGSDLNAPQTLAKSDFLELLKGIQEQTNEEPETHKTP